MARKERNDIDYFPHPVNHGKKMFYIRSKYGNDGYAVWFMLLEQLGKSTHHHLTLNDEVQLMYLSSEFKVSELLLEDIINTLVKLGEFDKELWEENGIIYNQKFVDNISDAYKKRNNDCIDRNSLEELLIAKGVRKQPISNPKPYKSESEVPGNTQSKVKYSKEEEIKEEEISKRTNKKFVQPSLLEVQNYCIERNNDVDYEKFIDHYTSNGWKVGKNQMKDWKASVRTWEKSSNQNLNNQNGTHKQTQIKLTKHQDAGIQLAKDMADLHYRETGERVPYERFLGGGS